MTVSTSRVGGATRTRRSNLLPPKALAARGMEDAFHLTRGTPQSLCPLGFWGVAEF
jgi:hypothetical protein